MYTRSIFINLYIPIDRRNWFYRDSRGFWDSVFAFRPIFLPVYCDPVLELSVSQAVLWLLMLYTYARQSSRIL